MARKVEKKGDLDLLITVISEEGMRNLIEHRLSELRHQSEVKPYQANIQGNAFGNVGDTFVLLSSDANVCKNILFYYKVT